MNKLIYSGIIFLFASNATFALSSKHPDLFTAEIDPYKSALNTNPTQYTPNLRYIDVPAASQFALPLIKDNQIIAGSGIKITTLPPNTNHFEIAETADFKTMGTIKLTYVDPANNNNFCEIIINDSSKGWLLTDWPTGTYQCTGNLRFMSLSMASSYQNISTYDYTYTLHFRSDDLSAIRYPASGSYPQYDLSGGGY